MTEQAILDGDSSTDDQAFQPRLSISEVQQLACIFKALADPTRLHILDILSQAEGKMGACELAGLVGIPNEDGQLPQQPTISHHLKVLKNVGLVKCSKEQQWVFYYVCHDRLQTLRTAIEVLRTSCD